MGRRYYGAPEGAWNTVMETLEMDAQSSAFDEDLRKEIGRAYDKLEEVTPDPVQQIKKLTATVARLRELLHANLSAWEDEEDSVQQEHRDLMKRTRKELR
jgi:hypothetical protein